MKLSICKVFSFLLILTMVFGMGCFTPALAETPTPYDEPDPDYDAPTSDFFPPLFGGYVIDASSVSLHWAKEDPSTEYCILYRRLDPGIESEEIAILTEHDYICTGLTEGQKYGFKVKAVNSQETSFFSDSVTLMPMAMPMVDDLNYTVDKTIIYPSTSRLLKIDLSWSVVPFAETYDVTLEADKKITSNGSYVWDKFYFAGTSITLAVPVPEEETTFTITLRGITNPGTVLECQGPTTEVSFTYTPFDWSDLRHIFYYEEVDPWDFPWNEDWIRDFLEVYWNPGLWTGETFGNGLLAGLSEHTLLNKSLSDTETQLMEALHPDGLALLKILYAMPPDEVTAGELARMLKEMAVLLGGRLPQALTGGELEEYNLLLANLNSLANFPHNTTQRKPENTVYIRPTPTPARIIRTLPPIRIIMPTPVVTIITGLPGIIP